MSKKLIGLFVLGLLAAGLLFSFTGFSGFDILPKAIENFSQTNKRNQDQKERIISHFAVLSDTHSDTANTKKAVQKAKDLGADYMILLGDLTTVGTIKELTEQKKILDSSGLFYKTAIGDHDLWQSGKENFIKVFGPTYESFDRNGIHHVLLDTSDTNIGVGKEQLNWLKNDLIKNKDKPILVFMQLSLYHPTNPRTIWEKNGVNPPIKKEAEEVIKMIGEAAVKGVFAGDHHFSSSYSEPTTGIRMRVVGAVTGDRNLQTPRFDLVSVFEDGNFEIKEIELED